MEGICRKVNIKEKVMVDKGYLVRFVYADSSQPWPSLSSDKGRSPPQGIGSREEEMGRIYATSKREMYTCI